MKDSEIIKKSEELLDKLLELLGMSCTKKISREIEEEDKNVLKIVLEGNDVGSLIGYRGNTLNALQLLFAQMLHNATGEGIVVLFDVNGYRERRAEYLQSLAFRAAREVNESGQNVELPPLPALERRIVHLALKDEKGIHTESEGEGEDRHIILKVDNS